jgi:uncharacterized protein DUF3467
MTTEPKVPAQALIQVVTGDEMSRGRYSNNMVVSHTPEEFIIDWLLNSPAGTHLVARVVVSPGHLKRIIGALADNLRRYEANFGDVKLIEPKDQMFH